jgi:hypothetical protein
VQHARLRVRQVEALARPRHRDVHQPALLLQAVALLRCVLVREQALLEAGDEDDVELQPLGRMHGHQLHRVLPLAGLMLAGFERGVREEGGQRTAIGAAASPSMAAFLQEVGRRVDQFVEVLQPLLAFLLGQVVLAQAAFRSGGRSLRAAADRGFRGAGPRSGG